MLFRSAISCPPEGSAGARLSLEQTRERLGALVEACGRSHGLMAMEMAEALTIATALALHACRDLVPLNLGAGLAVTGLVAWWLPELRRLGRLVETPADVLYSEAEEKSDE